MRKICSYIIIVVLVCISVGCTKTVYVPVETVKHDTIYQTAFKADSVQAVDSIYIKELIKGDTVYLEKIKYHFRDKVKMVIDTIVEKVVEVKEIPIEVEKKLTTWQQFKIDAGEWVIGGALLLLAILAVLWVINWRRR